MTDPEDRVKPLLDQLGRALAEAIASSSEVTTAAARIRGRGYAVQIILNCSQGGSESPTAPRETSVRAPMRAAPKPGSRPSFRLNARDVSFLESVGIDGTRPGRRPRRGSSG